MGPKKNPAAPGETEEAGAGPSFEEALERLETIVEQLEEGSLSLEQSIGRYEEGIRLSRRLSQQLDQAEKRIERLTEVAGEPATEPMDLENGEGAPADADATSPRAAREPRLSPRPPALPEPDELPF